MNTNNLKTSQSSEAINMKKYLSVTLMALSISIYSIPTKAADPCQPVLCMWGLVATGSVQDGCSGSVNNYFSQISFKHGKFSASRTEKKRRGWLTNNCPSASPAYVDKIQNKFGRLRF
ncbi:hypothetical protein, partial [Escherichia coli]